MKARFLLFTVLALVAARPAPPELPMPDEAHALLSVVPGLAAVGSVAGRLIVLGGSKNEERLAVSVPFKADGKTREEVFGKLTDQTRAEIVDGDELPDWRGVLAGPERPLFFDGKTLTWHEVDPKSLKSILRRSMPWDLIQPPKDRGGNGTAPEIAALRTAFKRAFQATPGVKATGVAAVPESWGAAKKKNMLLATRLKGYPLVMLECNPDEPSQCIVARQCHLEGAKDLLPEAITGLAVVEAKRLVLIGDKARHRILGFHFDSCYNVTRGKDFALPPKLKTLSNLAVDAEDRLLVTTARPDDFLNASLYWWAPKDWPH